jgi:hypothetical protein
MGTSAVFLATPLLFVNPCELLQSNRPIDWRSITAGRLRQTLQQLNGFTADSNWERFVIVPRKDLMSVLRVLAYVLSRRKLH